MTGCSGVFGLWIIDLIDYANARLDLSIKVNILTRSETAWLSRYPHIARYQYIQISEGDIRSFNGSDFRPTHVIHGATTSAHETYHGELAINKFNVLVDGTRNLFERLCKEEISSVLFLSSGAVYSPRSIGGRTNLLESSAPAPLTHDLSSALGHAKRAAEFLCFAYGEENNIPVRVARAFSFSGAGLPVDAHYALGDFVRQARLGESITIRGDGTARRSYLHFADLAIWILCLLSSTRRDLPDIINVGSDRAISIRELAEQVSAQFPHKPEVVVQSKPDFSVGNPLRSHYIPSIENARLYGLDQWTPLSKSIQNLLTSTD
jgi:UDP-glucuronate decarboxylase